MTSRRSVAVVNEETAAVVRAVNQLTNALHTLSVVTALAGDGPLRGEAVRMAAALIDNDIEEVGRITDRVARTLR